MPITPQNKRNVLINSGYDPDKYDIDEQGYINEKQVQQEQTQPAISTPVKPTQFTKPEQTGMLGTFSAHAAANVLPTGAGVAAGTAAATASLPFAPLAGPFAPVVPFVAGLGGGLAAAYGAHKLQEGVVEQVAPQANRYLEHSAQEHPYAAIGGSFAGSGPFFRPNPANVVRAGRDLFSAKQLAELTTAQKGNIANVGTGIGMGAVPAVQQYMNDQPVDKGQLALNLALGAIFNKPGGKSGAMGQKALKGSDKSALIADYNRALADKKLVEVNPYATEQVTPKSTIEAGRNLSVEEQALATGRDPETNKAVSEFQKRSDFVAEQHKQAEEMERQAEINKAEAQAMSRAQAAKAELDASEEALNSVKNIEGTGLRTARKSEALPNEVIPSTSLDIAQAEHEAKMRGTETALEQPIPEEKKFASTVIKQGVKPPVEPGGQENAYNMQQASRVLGETTAKPGEIIKMPQEKTPFESPKSLVLPDIVPSKTKNQTDTTTGEEIDPTYLIDKATADRLRAKGAPPQRGYGAGMVQFAQKFGAFRGVKVSPEGHLVDEKSGEILRGRALLSEAFGKNIVKLNTSRAATDSLFHEVGHTFMDDLAKHGSSTDKRVVRDAIDAVHSDPKYAEMRVADPELDAEEQLTSGIGRDSVKLLLTEPSLKQHAREVLTRLKVRWGKATVEDYRNYLSDRLLHDPAHSEYYASKYPIAPDTSVNTTAPIEQEKVPKIAGTEELKLKGQHDYISELNDDGSYKHISYDAQSKKWITQNKDKEGKPIGKPVVSDIKPKNIYIEPKDQKDVKSKFDEIRDVVNKAVPEENTKPKEGEQKLTSKFDQSDTDVRRNRVVRNQPDIEDTKPLFRTETEKQLATLRPFGITPDVHGTAPKNSVVAALKTKIPADELAALNESGLQEWLGSKNERVNVMEMKRWIGENGPKIAVKKFENNSSKAPDWVIEYNNLTHEYFDSLQHEGRENLREVLRGEKPVDDFLYKDMGLAKGHNVEYENGVRRYVELAEKMKNYKQPPENINKPHWSFVAPKSESQMPGYTEIAVIKQIPQGKFGDKIDRRNKFGESHSFPPNTIAFARGYMETGANGEKVFHVIEVQSDWAQQVKRETEALKRNEYPSRGQSKIDTATDPALNHYENLALKAAIEHARKEGATHIAISDADTAMLTEGHDRGATNEILGSFGTRAEAEYKGIEMKQRGDIEGYKVEEDTDPLNAKHRFYLLENTNKISQEKGMRLHYDQSLPNRLAKLTGNEGQRQSFGEHKMSLDLGQQSYGAENNYSQTRKDLILTNPDGSLKTDVSARVYPLEGVNKRLETEGNQFGMFSKFQKDVPDVAENLSRRPNDPVMLHITSGQYDKVAKINPEVGDALHKFGSEYSRLQGYGNITRDKLDSLPVEDISAALKTMRNAFRSGVKDWTPTTEAERVLSEMFSKYREIQIESGLKIGGEHTAGRNNAYVPDMLSDEAIRTLREKPYSVEAKKMREDWVKYLEESGKVTKEEATKLVTDYVGGMKGKPLFGVEFGALRKAEGLGMPESIRESDPFKMVDKYSRRASKDIAYYKHLQSNDRIAAALGLPRKGEKISVEGVQDISSMPEVEGAMKAVSNDFSYMPSKAASVARLLSNTIMQLGTGIRNTAQVPSNIAPYIQRFSDLNALLAPMKAWKQNAIDSLSTNARSKRLDDTQIGRIVDPNFAEQVMDRISQGLRVVGGREILEQSNRIYTYGVGDYLVKDNYQRMLAGDAKGKRFIEQMSKHSTDAERVMRGEATTEDFMRMAKEFVDKAEGTYDARGLPIEALEGPMSPFLALSRWSLEKFNTIQKDVVTPMIREGNFLPFLMYTGSSFMSGLAIKQLNELLSNKKSSEASFEEAKSAGQTKDLVAAVVNTMQLGSYAGIASDFFKAGSDTLLKGKPTTSGLSFPLADFVRNGVGQSMSDYSAAVESGVPREEAALGLMQQLAKNYVQNYRYWYNNYSEEGKKNVERQDKYRDFRVWEELQGKTPSVPTHVNPVLNTDERKFKQTSDIGEAASELKKIVDTTIAKYGNDPYRMSEELTKKLRGLKANSYQTMPSPESLPISFMSYLTHLKKTQGEGAANARLLDYLKQSALNQAKSEMIP